MATIKAENVYVMAKHLETGEITRMDLNVKLRSVVFETGFEVLECFYKIMQQTVSERIPTLERGKTYTSKSLVGTTYCERPMDAELQNIAEILLANMVRENLLPLTCVTQRNRTPKKYRLQ